MAAGADANGFDEQTFEGKARARWGNTPQYREFQQKWSSCTEEQKARIKAEGREIIRRMVREDPQARPGDPQVQGAVGAYYQYLNRYFYRCQVEFLRDLAGLWVQDPRFSINYERIRQGGAVFVSQAVAIFCDRALA